MKELNKLIKAASRIQVRLNQLQKNIYSESVNQIEILISGYSQFAITNSKIRKALQKNWISAAKHLQQQNLRLIDDLSYTINKTKQFAAKPLPELPAISSIFADLRQIEQDCGKLNFDFEQDKIFVETEDIYLEDLYLGAFKIELRLDMLPELHKTLPYYCIALDPQYPVTSDDVTHPHVSNNILCEGDGATTIKTALEEGRLCDFFCIVTNILKTYNPDSPYVSLHDWSGIACYDCGYICDNENRYYCASCENDFCDSCSSYCRVCDEIICLGCGGQCPHCEEFICPSCINECSLFGSKCCHSCLEEGMCPTCIELERKNNDESREKDQTTSEADKKSEATRIESERMLNKTCPAIQSDGMG